MMDPVTLTIDAGVAIVTLNRPDHGNSWTLDVSRTYFPMFEQLAVDPAVRVVLVTGAGKAFCVGGDGGKLQDAAHNGQPVPAGQQDYWAPARIGKPVIAAINGACFGIGLQQILCCDLRFASQDAKFSTAYARRGLPAEFGMSWLLPRIVGIGHAMDLFLSGRLVRAAEAQAMGLVNRVVPADELLTQATAYARDLVERCSPWAMRAMKQQVYADLAGNMADAYALSAESLKRAMLSGEFREGVQSWQERRLPDFPPLDPGLARIDLGD